MLKSSQKHEKKLSFRVL